MKKKFRKAIYTVFTILTLANVISLTGCGKMENDGTRMDKQIQAEVSEAEKENPKVQMDTDTVQAQNDEQVQGAETDIVIRAYSDTEKGRMKELQESYQNETAKPEKMIQEVDSADDVTEGTLCYIISTGEYYLPDRELTDEELLEIIDCNFRISLNTNRKTQAEYEAEDRAKRAELEAKVKAAGGISEEKAVEIAQKAMETDLGEKAKELKLCINTYGWSSDLRVSDWSEIKEKDKGALAYSVGFNNVKEGMEIEDWLNYVCVVNAADGSILEAYTIQGLGDNTVCYEH